MDKFSCVTCGMKFQSKPFECPSCRQTTFIDLSGPVAEGPYRDPVPEIITTGADPEDEDEDESPSPAPAARHKSPGRKDRPAPKKSRKGRGSKYRLAYAMIMPVV